MRANYIRPLIRRAGMKNADLARELGISEYALSRRINGTSPWLWTEVLAAAKILQIPAEEWEQVFGGVSIAAPAVCRKGA